MTKKPATAYARGRALEYRVKAHLEDRGWAVIRSAGSGGAADLWASKAGLLLLVQVKRTGRIGNADWNTLLAIANVAGGWAVLAGARMGGPLVFERLMMFRERGSRERRTEILEP